MRPGVFDGFHRCLPAFAEAGNNTEYDLEIDATQPTAGNVARLITAWQARGRPTAFERMAIHGMRT